MEEEIYMRRCIELARGGLCRTAPNPMVGAVIVCDGRIIGEGYHARCGQAHAEVRAIESVRRPELLRRSTLYVSLEPCAHWGKTPPCADLIIAKGIPRIVVGCRDPFAQVNGLGIRRLRDAGREVVVGVLEQECRALIRRFITFHTRQRPYVTLKWAESQDGYVDRVRDEGEPAQLSSPRTLMRVHKLRAEHAAILVGTRTGQLDDPSLTVRSWAGPSPVRVIIDRRLTLPRSLHLFDGSAPTLVFTHMRTDRQPTVEGVEYITLPPNGSLLHDMLGALHQRGLQSVLVEGGPRLLTAFIEERLWDEAFVEISPVRLGNGVAAPTMSRKFLCQTAQHFGHIVRHYTANDL